jgi:hypothetical protein
MSPNGDMRVIDAKNATVHAPACFGLERLGPVVFSTGATSFVARRPERPDGPVGINRLRERDARRSRSLPRARLLPFAHSATQTGSARATAAGESDT